MANMTGGSEAQAPVTPPPAPETVQAVTPPPLAASQPAPVVPVPIPAPVPAPVPQAVFSAQSTWRQNFLIAAPGTPDPSVWRHELLSEVPAYNDEKQAYTASTSNVRVEPGAGLVIEARKEPYAYPGDPGRTYQYTSGRIDTRNSFSFEYGKVEAVMKMPRGAGAWPAFWFLSANQAHTNKLNPTAADWNTGRFYLHDGELDGVEYYGNMPGLIEATVHTFLDTFEGNVMVPDSETAFHTYGVEVTPSQITWSADGVPYFTQQKPSNNTDAWPFGNGNKLYVILNLAMGGSGGGTIDDSRGPWRFEIQDISYYPYTGN